MKYELFSEKELVDLARLQDSEAFEQLILKNKEYIMAWIYRMCKGDDHLSEEIYQIATIKSWKNISKFKGESKFSTWVCSISRNLFIDTKRKKDRLAETSLFAFSENENDEDKIRFEASVEYDPLVNFKLRELDVYLSDILDKLSPEHSAVLRYFAVEQLTYEEIAKAMQCSIGTVMSRLFYARKKAQKMVSQSAEVKKYCDI